MLKQYYRVADDLIIKMNQPRCFKFIIIIMFTNRNDEGRTCILIILPDLYFYS